jgi:aminobenzoyl-glutamate utilization protein B
MSLRWWAGMILCAACFAADKDDVLARMDARATHFGEVSRQIWDYAELGYKETRSAALLRDELRSAGFRVEEGAGGIPTAFTATWGSGKPVVGIMGEYDALPGLSQDTQPERNPLVNGAPGHGCGHNLLGTASAFAAISVKEWMTAKGIQGTLRFYGTPAEEGGGGKLYMIRAGLFQDVDVVLSWHPNDINLASKRSTLAITSAKFRFYGKPAHAAASPDAGRSALDAAQLMTYGVEMMREHVPEQTRIHYIFTNGGAAPNIVPDFAEVFLYARHPSSPVLDGIWEWIRKCAEAGALGTQTRTEMEFVDSSYNTLPNDALSELVDRNLRRVGGVTYTPEETAFAEQLRNTFTGTVAPLGSQEKIEKPEDGVDSFSTDAGDVSWVVPMSQLFAATFVPGTSLHTWQSAATAGMSIGRKGMVVAAKTLALSAMDLFTDPANVRAARESFEKRRAGYEYRSRVPADHKAPLNYRDTK